MLPKFPIRVAPGFPGESVPEQVALWNSEIGRAFVLLWRPCHLVNQDFWSEALHVVKTLERERPQTLEEFKRIFGVPELRFSNFTSGDVERFLPEALPYLLGEKEVPYEMLEASDA